MPDPLSPHLTDLIRDALLKSYWFKSDLKQFLIHMGVDKRTIAALSQDDSKRSWLDQLIPEMQKLPKGVGLLRKIAYALADQTSFPRLTGMEDSALRIEAARESVAALSSYLSRKKKEWEDERSAAQRRKSGAEARVAVQRSQVELGALKDRLDKLVLKLGSQEAGYEFQTWFYDLMDYFDVNRRKPYTSNGRQIDGSVTIDGTTYLVETKFTRDQSDATDIDSLMAKVVSKADNTMGIMVSVSGYSSVAINEASKAKSPLLLIEGTHLYHVLMGNMAFDALIGRIRRHSAQEGKAYLPVNEFGG